jgi:hypothetical protein
VVNEIGKLANLWIDLAATDSSSSQDTVEEPMNGIDDQLHKSIQKLGDKPLDNLDKDDYETRRNEPKKKTKSHFYNRFDRKLDDRATVVERDEADKN